MSSPVIGLTKQRRTKRSVTEAATESSTTKKRKESEDQGQGALEGVSGIAPLIEDGNNENVLIDTRDEIIGNENSHQGNSTEASVDTSLLTKDPNEIVSGDNDSDDEVTGDTRTAQPQLTAGNDQNESSDEEQQKGSKRPRSWVWQYFTRDKIKMLATCRICPNKVYNLAKSQGSTKALINHLTIKHEIPKGGHTDGTVVLTNGNQLHVPYSTKNLRYCILNWIVKSDQPFSTVEEDSFQLMMNCATNKQGDIIKAHSTIKLDCQKMHVFAVKWIKKELDKIKSKISFTVDAASTKYKMYSLLGITAHWIDDEFVIKNLGLCTMPLKGSHTGENLKDSFIAGVEGRFNLLEKLVAVTCDSAANNGTFMKHLVTHCQEQNIFNIHRTGSRMNCFAHIINLAVKALLKTLNKEVESHEFYADEEDESSDYETDEEERATRRPSKNVVKKLRQLVDKIKGSGQRREVFEKIYEELKVKHLELIIDCETRWNSTYDMMERALKMRQVIERFILKISDPVISSFALSKSEWDYILKASVILKDFKEASESMSNAQYPTLVQTLPYFQLLLHNMNVYLNCNVTEEPNVADLVKNGKPKTLVEAVKNARKLFEKYFKLANNPESPHSIATILHPRFKLEYFKRSGWDSIKLEKAKTKIQNMWDSTYKPVDAVNQSQMSQDLSNESHNDVIDMLWSTCRQQAQFSNSQTFQSGLQGDELERYFEMSIESARSCPNALMWWKKHAIDFPNLSKMAMDYFSIPATSVPVEGRFSNLVDIVTPNRATLDVETIQILHELKEFLNFGGNELFSKILSEIN